MAATPRYKVYNSQGECIAAFKYAEDAACFVAALGSGATIRDGHSKKDIVWIEGEEQHSASESYDFVAAMILKRKMQGGH